MREAVLVVLFADPGARTMARGWGRRVAKIAGYVILGLLVLAAFAITFTVGWRPEIGAKKRPLTSRKFQATPERVRRGEYIVHAVIPCMNCHSTYDEKAEPPVLLSKEGAGKILYDDGSFRFVAPNITSDPETGIGKWTDDAIARAIREVIAADGSALLPVMPYGLFRDMSDEDLASVVVFIRSLPPVRSELPPTKLPFLFTRLIQSAPRPVSEPGPDPDTSTLAKHGTYLAGIGTCSDCHTPLSPKFQPLPGMELAGGNPMGENVVSANITPDASGIGYYDEALFIEAIRTGHVRARKLKPAMPWWVYRNMTDDDLKALFAYLRTVKPVHQRSANSVVRNTD
jgi:mono/diheme cytochrome c family protein